MKDRIDFYINLFNEIIKRSEDDKNKAFSYIAKKDYLNAFFNNLPCVTQKIFNSDPIYVERTISDCESFIRTPGCILQISKEAIYAGHLANTKYQMHISHELDDWCQLGTMEAVIEILTQVIKQTIPELEES